MVSFSPKGQALRVSSQAPSAFRGQPHHAEPIFEAFIENEN